MSKECVQTQCLRSSSVKDFEDFDLKLCNSLSPRRTGKVISRTSNVSVELLSPRRVTFLANPKKEKENSRSKIKSSLTSGSLRTNLKERLSLQITNDNWTSGRIPSPKRWVKRTSLTDPRRKNFHGTGMVMDPGETSLGCFTSVPGLLSPRGFNSVKQEDDQFQFPLLAITEEKEDKEEEDGDF